MAITAPDAGCLHAAGASAGLDGRPLVVVAAVALVDGDGRILLGQRPVGAALEGLWEFPGGKLKAGETPEVAVVRELKEELDLDIAESCLAPFTFASHRYETFHLLMPLYLCRTWRGTPRPLTHAALRWVRPLDMPRLPMPPADIPLISMLRDFL